MNILKFNNPELMAAKPVKFIQTKRFYLICHYRVDTIRDQHFEANHFSMRIKAYTFGDGTV